MLVVESVRRRNTPVSSMLTQTPCQWWSALRAAQRHGHCNHAGTGMCGQAGEGGAGPNGAGPP